jgi:Clp protease
MEWKTVPSDAVQDYTDLMSYLLRNRIIFVGARIDDQVSGKRDHQQHRAVQIVTSQCLTPCTLSGCACLQLATQTVAQMLALEAIDPTADIRLYINSAGVVCQAFSAHSASARILATLPQQSGQHPAQSLHGHKPRLALQVGHHMQWLACWTRSGPSSRRSAQSPWATAPAQRPCCWCAASPVPLLRLTDGP